MLNVAPSSIIKASSSEASASVDDPSELWNLTRHESTQHWPRPRRAIFRKWCQVHNRLKGLLVDSWAIEIASLILSIALFITMIVVFRVWDTQELASWNESYPSLSFNTLVAILSISSKVTLLLPVTSAFSQIRWMHFRKRRSLMDFEVLEAASRGPLGSIRALLSVRSFPTALASTIILVATLFEIFSQQAVGSVVPSFIPALRDLGNDILSSLSPMYMNNGLRNAAVIALGEGFISPGSHFGQSGGLTYCSGPPSDPCRYTTTPGLVSSYSCAKEYCLSPFYASLSFCPRCENVVQDLLSRCNEDGQGCVWRLPDGTQLHIDDESAVLGSREVVESDSLDVLLANVSVIAKLNDTISESNITNLVAATCDVHLCAQVYQLQASALVGALERSFFRVDTAALREDRGSDIVFSYVIPNGSVLNLHGYYAAGPNTTWQSSIAPFTADLSTVRYLRTFFRSTFNGTARAISTGSDPSDYYQRPAGADLWDLFALSIQQEWTGDSTLLESMYSLTLGMANWYRENAGSVNALPNWHGDEDFDQGAPYISIRWAWLSLPAGLEILATTLLALTILQTKAHRGFPVWKSNAMATLFHGPDLMATSDVRLAQKISAMEALAANKSVRLNASSGYRLLE